MPFSNTGAEKPPSRRISLALCLLLLAFINTYAQKPELVAQVGHTQAPHWLKFGLQGRILISAGDDHLITVWDVAQQRLLLTAPFVSGGYTSLDDQGGAFSFNLDGTFMAVHTALDTIKVWNLTSGQVTRTVKVSLPAHSSPYEELGISNDGRFLSRVFADRVGDGKTADNYSLQVWDVIDGAQRTFALGAFDSAAAEFSSDGRLLMLATPAEADVHKGLVWDVVGGRKLYEITDRSRRISGEPGYFNHDGQLLLVLDGSKLQVIEAASGKLLLPITALDEKSERLVLAEVSADHKYLAAIIRTFRSGSHADVHTLKLWRVADGQQIRATQISSSNFDVSSLRFSANSEFIVCRVGALEETRLKAWNVSTGAERFAVKVDNYSNVVLSQDDRLLALGDRNEGIDLRSTLDGSTVKTLSGHSSNMGGIDFTSDGKYLISSSRSSETEIGKVGVWTLLAGEFRRNMPGELVTRNSDGSRIVTRVTIKNGPDEAKANGQNGSPRYENSIWNVETGEKIRTFEGDVAYLGTESPTDVVVATTANRVVALTLETGREIARLPASGILSPNGRYLAETLPEKWVTQIYSVATGGIISSLNWSHDADNSDASPIWVSGFSPDSRYFAASINSSAGENVLEVRDVMTGKLRQSFPGSYQSADYHYNSIFSSDGSTLITGGEPPQIWDLATGKERNVSGSLALPAGMRYADEVSFSPHEKYLVNVIAGERSSVCLWEVTRDHGLSLRAKSVYDGDTAVFSADDRVLATIGEDKMIKLWDIASERLLGTIVPFDSDNWLAIAPDGRFDGTPSAWNRIFWRFPDNLLDTAPIEIFFNEFYYPGLLADIYADKLRPLAMTIGQKDRRQPRVEVSLSLKPESAGATRDRTARIQITVTQAPPDAMKAQGSGAQDVRLFRNGSLVKAWRGDVLKGQNDVSLEADIPLVAGENRLTAYAFNHDNIKSADATLVVKAPDSLKRSGTAFILAVGINSYSNPQYNLKYAVADADDFSTEVKKQQESLKRYAQLEVISLSDREATKANIIQKLTQLAARVQPEDAVIIYFAGHGTAHGNQFYLIPHDLGYTGPRENLNEAGLQTILAHSISDRELEKLFEGIDAGQLLLVIDACNSGQALEAEEKRRGPMNSKGLAQLAYEKGMYVLTAAQSYQAAQEAAKFGHGFLTYALVEEGLKQGAADREPKNGAIDLREWLNYATEEVPRMQQQNSLEALRGRGRYITFAGDGKGPKDPRSNLQRPRIFYRRELETTPFIIGVLQTSSVR